MTSEPVFIEFGPVSQGLPLPSRDDAPREYAEDVVTRLREDAEQIMGRYPDTRSALLPLLHLVQSEDGYITPAGVAFCADCLELSVAEVAAVATFYSMYRREPTGEYLVGVCTNTLCAIMGGDAILAALEDHLGVASGDTTGDAKITVEHIECNAACDFAPVMMVNWEFFDNSTPESARTLVDELRSGKPVTPTRGATLCTFKETARILAGFPDRRPGASDAEVRPQTIAGLRVAQERAMTAPKIPENGRGAGQSGGE
ncbi:NADH-quinone oxidoreductase subunit NuoE [Rhodococcus sp. NPDC058521]|uniref:NADH-quinone oxidoreductase subunit NuoE n=1 Tax=Rhodococcus sp. NPDC058521 TaxID=3346536 RepID=UPI003661FACA